MSRPRILIAASVRQSPEVFQLYLDGLRALDTRGLDVHRRFWLHNSPQLADLLRDDESFVLHTSDEADVRADDTHRWTPENVRQIIAMKNAIARYAIDNGFDAVFMADSDLILHPKTLQALWGAGKDIIAEAFWTSWHPGETPMPNAWDFDSYGFIEGHPGAWLRPGVHPVGMTGACILVKTDVYRSGVTYDEIPVLSFWGEDRNFCIRAAVAGYRCWIDTHFPPAHLYRSSDVRQAMRPRKLVAAMIVRNEAGRYLERVLDQLRRVCDAVIVYDDASTDGTPEICERFGAKVIRGPDSRFMSDESSIRQIVWDEAVRATGDGNWVIALDADETIEEGGLQHLHRLMAIAEYNGCDALVFRLYDMWNETHYRDDEHWTGHKRLWPIMVRVSRYTEYWWRTKRVHSGRFPANAGLNIYDSGLRIQHWGWSRPEDRERKYKRYMRQDPEGKYGFLGQYESILDPSPNLVRWES